MTKFLSKEKRLAFFFEVSYNTRKIKTQRFLCFYHYTLYEQEEFTMDIKDVLNWKKSGLFAAGVLFGTAGIKILSSKDAKNFYTSCTAAVLRAKDCVMKTATCVQENATDIYESAKQMNEERAAAEEAFEDETCDAAEDSFEEESDATEEAPAEATEAE